MNNDSCPSEPPRSEAQLTGIDEPPAELLARSAARIAAAASRYRLTLASNEKPLSDAKLRRLDQLEQCAQFFWMCSEVVEPQPDIHFVDTASLQRECLSDGTPATFRDLIQSWREQAASDRSPNANAKE